VTKAFRTVAQIHVDIVKGPKNSRFMYAATQIAASPLAVYRALSAYDSLQTFIPGLAENKCIERRENGARLLQVGTQDLGFGIVFTARCVLDVYEWPGGIPSEYLAEQEEQFPVPRSGEDSMLEVSDISFELIDGDLQVFKGLWRMMAEPTGGTQLSYSLLIRPPSWVPVALLERRIGDEVKSNLIAVASYVEKNQDALLSVPEV